MTKVFWIAVALFLIGDGLFVLPVHFSIEKLSSSYFINYKKDSVLLHTAFPDSIIPIHLNMPVMYRKLYNKIDSGKERVGKPPFLLVNVTLLHNADFASLSFPFYKVANYSAEISFYSIVKINTQPGRDSVALIGNITISGKLSVKGICTPLYARSLVENEMVVILKKEMKKVQDDINRPVVEEPSYIITEEIKYHPSKPDANKQKKIRHRKK